MVFLVGEYVRFPSLLGLHVKSYNHKGQYKIDNYKKVGGLWKKPKLTQAEAETETESVSIGVAMGKSQNFYKKKSQFLVGTLTNDKP